MLEIALTIQLLSCAAMTGIIWMVQIAIYPLFTRLEGDVFDDYHTRYMNRVPLVIAPFMLLEATSCAACLYLGDWRDFPFPTILLAIAWASTALIQVPQHAKLTPAKVPAIVKTNWIRTIAWTTRLIILAILHSSSS